MSYTPETLGRMLYEKSQLDPSRKDDCANCEVSCGAREFICDMFAALLEQMNEEETE